MSLIALMSVGVISLVVCLVAIFLSVTEGIEKSWLKKLTALHAPIRITPTPAYYSSYYYQIDSLSSASGYEQKTIREKHYSKVSNPYSPEADMELPPYFAKPDHNPDGSLKDPVKMAFQILEKLKKTHPDLTMDDYEIAGAMLRLTLQKQGGVPSRQSSQNTLTQAAYVSSFPEKSPTTESLLLPPTEKDALPILRKVEQDAVDLPKEMKNLFSYMEISKLSSPSMWEVPSSFLPEKFSLLGVAYIHKEQIGHIVLSKDSFTRDSANQMQGSLERENGNLVFKTKNKKYVLDNTVLLCSKERISLQTSVLAESLQECKAIEDIRFSAKGTLQNVPIQGILSLKDMEVTECKYQTQVTSAPSSPLPWVYSLVSSGKGKKYFLPQDPSGIKGVLLSKNFQESGAKIGDKGFLSFLAPTGSSMQEQQIPVYVAGFYDPGIMSIGFKAVFADPSVTRSLQSTNQLSAFDRLLANGIHVWNADLEKTKALQKEIETAFAKEGIREYWNVASFHEYDFAKDLLQQFQSDKYLFSLIGIVILLVACSNIISLLILLVNDKKKEIGILQAMGTSKLSVAVIFGTCGTLLGVISSSLGMLGAYFLLHNIDTVVHILSTFQGQETFHPAFYGNSLPKELSSSAIHFILYTAPILSLLAGLIPAIKACRFQPSQMLRNES